MKSVPPEEGSPTSRGRSLRAPHRRWRGARRYAATVCVAVAGVAVTVAAWLNAGANAERHELQGLRETAHTTTAAIQNNLDVYLEVVNSLASLFRASDEVTRADFVAFTRPAIRRYRGIQALEWAPKVMHDEREALERSVREEGYSGFHFTERGDDGRLIAARRRRVYFPVLFLEPVEGNESAFGYADMGRSRREAIERARDEGRTVASRRLRLIQEEEDQFGVIVFAPVFDSAEVVPAVSERRGEAFRGVVEGVFRVDDLVDDGIHGLDLRAVQFSLFDEADPDDSRPLYRYPRLAGEPAPSRLPLEGDYFARATAPPSERTIVRIADRRWVLAMRPTSGALPSAWSWPSVAVLIVGLVITFLLVALVGQIQSRASHIQDLVRRRTAELESANERLELARVVIERAVVAVVRLDASGEVVGVNGAACELYGYDRRELLESSAARLQPDLSGSAWDEHWEKLKTKKAITYTCEHQGKGGAAIPVEVTANLLKYRDRSYACWFVSDVTERRRAEAALRASAERLQQSQKLEAVGMLAGGVAHDFNNLLSGILGFAEIGLMKLEPEHPVRRYLTEVVKAANRASSLTKQLLAFSRRQSQKPEVFQINDIVGDMGEMLSRIIGEDVTLELVLGDDVPPVYADPTQIEQVLLNLCINARDAMPNGGRLTLETSAVQVGSGEGEVAAEELGLIAADELPPGTYVKLSARDTGTGMAPEVLAHLFEPFFTTKPAGKGTGLGLATVYGIVTQSQGAIAVDSVLGEGTTFDIYLPRVPSTEQLPRMYDAQPDPVEFPPTKHRRTILLVEDEPTVRDLCFDVLHDHGYEVLQASSGEKALELFAQHRDGVDLLLTDVVMPGMSGLELAEAVLAMQAMPVVIMTGYSEKQEQVESLPDARLLMKPFSPSDLLTEVKSALRVPSDQAVTAS